MNDLEREELAFRLAQQAAGKQLEAELMKDPNFQANLEALKRSGGLQTNEPDDHGPQQPHQ